MAGVAAKMVLAVMEAKEIKTEVCAEDLIKIGWNIEGGNLTIYLKFDETDTHVHLEGLNFVKVPEKKYDNMYKLLNECNNLYSHVKFVLDIESGQIIARDDAIIQLDTCGEECYELMIRMLQIVEDAFPKFMKAIWA